MPTVRREREIRQPPQAVDAPTASGKLPWSDSRRRVAFQRQLDHHSFGRGYSRMEIALDANSTPTLKDLAIGVPAVGEREEFDSMGKVMVPADRYWGAQTQRSLQHFSIGDDRMPKAVYHAYGYVKKACALVNHEAGRLPAMEEGRHRSCGGRDHLRQAGRELPSLRLADRFGHSVEYERQRGDLEPGHPAPGRRARHAASGRPQRRRQYGPVVQRHLPDRDAYRGGVRAGRTAAAEGRCVVRRPSSARRRAGRTSSRSDGPISKTLFPSPLARNGTAGRGRSAPPSLTSRPVGPASMSLPSAALRLAPASTPRPASPRTSRPRSPN